MDIELAGEHTAGTTVVDLWNYRNIPLLPSETKGAGKAGWSGEGRNVWLVEELEVSSFDSTFTLFCFCLRVRAELTASNSAEGRWILESIPRGSRSGRTKPPHFEYAKGHWKPCVGRIEVAIGV